MKNHISESYRSVLTLFLLILLWLITTNTQAQFSAYHGILFPYDNPSKVIYSAGSLTYALPDYSLNIQNNPVNSMMIEFPQVFTSFDQDISKYTISDYIYDAPNPQQLEPIPTKYSLYPSFVSAVLPIKSFKKKFVIAAYLAKINFPEREVATSGAWNSIPYQKKGNVWNASVGISHNLPYNTSVGISLSKWMGSWKFENDKSHSIFFSGKFRYIGNILNLGILKQYKRVSLSFIYHSPSTLMKTENVFLNRFGQNTKHEIQQHFNGAFKVGGAYHWNEKITLSAGYRYQARFSMQDQLKTEGSDNIKIKEEYGRSHQLSIAGEYIINHKNRKYPVFLAYWTDWLPSTPETIPKSIENHNVTYNRYHIQGFQFLYIENHANRSNNLAFGIRFPFYFTKIHLTGQWQQNRVFVLNYINCGCAAPILSKENFNAKKSTFMLGIGVSYAFKKE